MLNSMLLLAQLDSNIESLDLARWPLHSLVNEVLKHYQLQVQQHALTITCDIPEDITVITNREFALLMIGNIVENAIKFTLNHQIMLVATKDETGVQLSIADFGPGIPADEAPFIFDRFYRGRTVQNEVPGSGLGLALVKTLTQYCECKVSVAPHAEGGSVFKIAWSHKVSVSGT